MTLKWEVAHLDTPAFDGKRPTKLAGRNSLIVSIADGEERVGPLNVLTTSDEYELCGEAFSPFARTPAG